MIPATAENADDDLRVSAVRSGDDLAWVVRNATDTPVWAYVFVPALVNGALRITGDTAWVRLVDGVAVISLTDAPVPPKTFAERPQIGAVRIEPNQQIEGHVKLGDRVTERWAFGAGTPQTFALDQLVLEVGWIPVREDQTVKVGTWEGGQTSFVPSERAPGGQRISRSATIDW